MTVVIVQQSKGAALSATSVGIEQESALASLAGVAEGADLEVMTRAEAMTPVVAMIQGKSVAAAVIRAVTIGEAQAEATHLSLVEDGTAMIEAEDVTALLVIEVGLQSAAKEAAVNVMVTEEEVAIDLVLALALLKSVVAQTIPLTLTVPVQGAQRLREDHSRRVQEEVLQAVVDAAGTIGVKAQALRLSDRSMAISLHPPTDRTQSCITKRARMATMLLS